MKLLFRVFKITSKKLKHVEDLLTVEMARFYRAV